jgi:hypothetical protein
MATSLRTLSDYKWSVELAEAQHGRDSIKIGDALIDLAQFYKRAGLLDAENDCYEHMNGILEKYFNVREGERLENEI